MSLGINNQSNIPNIPYPNVGDGTEYTASSKINLQGFSGDKYLQFKRIEQKEDYSPLLDKANKLEIKGAGILSRASGVGFVGLAAAIIVSSVFFTLSLVTTFGATGLLVAGVGGYAVRRRERSNQDAFNGVISRELNNKLVHLKEIDYKHGVKRKDKIVEYINDLRAEASRCGRSLEKVTALSLDLEATNITEAEIKQILQAIPSAKRLFINEKKGSNQITAKLVDYFGEKTGWFTQRINKVVLTENKSHNKRKVYELALHSLNSLAVRSISLISGGDIEASLYRVSNKTGVAHDESLGFDAEVKKDPLVEEALAAYNEAIEEAGDDRRTEFADAEQKAQEIAELETKIKNTTRIINRLTPIAAKGDKPRTEEKLAKYEKKLAEFKAKLAKLKGSDDDDNESVQSDTDDKKPVESSEMEVLRAEVAALKAAQNKSGWFSW